MLDLPITETATAVNISQRTSVQLKQNNNIYNNRFYQLQYIRSKYLLIFYNFTARYLLLTILNSL